jgi:hypothetical protein
MTEVLYQSDHANLSVPRPWDGKRNFEGKAEVKGPIPFIDGWLTLDSEKDQDDIGFLDSHTGNKANGGTSFRKMSNEVMGLKAIEEGNTFASPPEDGVPDVDLETFKYLSELPASLPPNTFNKALKLAIDIYERYSMVGVPKPNDKFSQKRLRACIVEMIATLEDRGIWDDDIHRQEDTGSGSEKD